MSTAIPKLSAVPKPPPPPEPAVPAARTPAPTAAVKPPEPRVRPPHAPAQAAALSPGDVSYVDSLMGALPAQKMEEVLLRTGVPLPAHLGQGLDAAV